MDKKVEQDVERIQSGEVHKIYPILKPGDWVGLRAGCVRQTLFGTPENPTLVVGFGYDAADNFVFLTQDDPKMQDPKAILKEAYENLENFPSEFAVTETPHGKILTASGNDFSAEKILCDSHLLKAHELLNADELLVSIPRRRCMMVMAKGAGKDLQDTFLYLHQEVWNDDSYGNAPILDALFVVVNGQIEGLIPLGE